MPFVRKHVLASDELAASDTLPAFVADALAAQRPELWWVRAREPKRIDALGLYWVSFRLVVNGAPERYLADCHLLRDVETGTLRSHVTATAHKTVTAVTVVWRFVRRPAISLPLAVLADVVFADVHERYPTFTF